MWVRLTTVTENKLKQKEDPSLKLRVETDGKILQGIIEDNTKSLKNVQKRFFSPSSLSFDSLIIRVGKRSTVRLRLPQS